MTDLAPYQAGAYDRLLDLDRALVVTSMGLGARTVVARAAAARSREDQTSVQVIDSRAMYLSWLREFGEVQYDPRYVVTPQWVTRHYMLPIDAADALTVVCLDSVGMYGTKSCTRIRDYLGDMRAKWEGNPPRLIAMIDRSSLMRRLPLVSRLFPVDGPVVNLTGGDDFDLASLRDAYVKATVVKPWGTETPGRGFLARRWEDRRPRVIRVSTKKGPRT